MTQLTTLGLVVFAYLLACRSEHEFEAVSYTHLARMDEPSRAWTGKHCSVNDVIDASKQYSFGLARTPDSDGEIPE